ncbi:MAG: hypothetical protein EOM69_10155, partial [Clostridia bacterium]|nr:hypothetical protein [Clostridia bacterium]
MKLTTVASRLEGAPLCCPLCGDALKTREGRSLACGQGHCYDLSKKGYVNLAPQRDQKGEKYDAALFAARERVFADGFYQPVLDAIARELPAQERFTMVDVGCGE